MAERYVDGSASEEEFSALLEDARGLEGYRPSQPVLLTVPSYWRVLRLTRVKDAIQCAEWLAEGVSRDANDTHAALRAAPGDEIQAARAAWQAAKDVKSREQAFQCDLVRDIFGNPFRPIVAGAISLPPQAVQLAQAIYQSRAFERMAHLADVLEDLAWSDAALLAHCREFGPHTRGCWVLDLILRQS
jgi:hypothetical protein